MRHRQHRSGMRHRAAAAAGLCALASLVGCGDGVAPPPELPIATVDLPLPPPAAPLPAATASAAAPPPVEDRGEGLLVQDLVVGHGRPAESGDTVAVHYVGTLEDHTEFDNSRARKRPFEVELGKGTVIKGWERGIPGMRVGGKRRLTIPPDLAYGPGGHPPKIPPSSTLIFEVEMIAVNRK